MNALELKRRLEAGELARYADLYENLTAQSARMCAAIDAFTKTYGEEREIGLFSVPGRSEICGNHTDHNNGCVLAGAIDRDVLAVASKNDEGVIRLYSEGYPMAVIPLDRTGDPAAFQKFTSVALIAGMCAAFQKHGHSIVGFDAYATTEVLKGSGISSSAAFEVMIGNILNHLANNGEVPNEEIAKYAQYAENVYFGKPCGLMDQMACAVGGFVYIDFADPQDPIIEPIQTSLSDAGYDLCIVNTGGNHADLNEDYASVPAEMKAVAKEFGKTVLRGIEEKELIDAIPSLRKTVGDRAILRALHFMRENLRVLAARDALKENRIQDFLATVTASGRSSFTYLQNVYTVKNVREQGLSLALALAEEALEGEGAFRVHGGGFAGTVQIFLPKHRSAQICRLMDSVFGEGAAMHLRIRPLGAVRLF